VYNSTTEQDSRDFNDGILLQDYDREQHAERDAMKRFESELTMIKRLPVGEIVCCPDFLRLAWFSQVSSNTVS
jgi:hypothetical protein